MLQDGISSLTKDLWPRRCFIRICYYFTELILISWRDLQKNNAATWIFCTLIFSNEKRRRWDNICTLIVFWCQTRPLKYAHISLDTKPQDQLLHKQDMKTGRCSMIPKFFTTVLKKITWQFIKKNSVHFQGHYLTLHVNCSRLSWCDLWVKPPQQKCTVTSSLHSLWLAAVCLPACTVTQHDRSVMCRQTGCSSLLPAGTRTLTAFSVNASAFFLTCRGL